MGRGKSFKAMPKVGNSIFRNDQRDIETLISRQQDVRNKV
jgi:hypothetical protein